MQPIMLSSVVLPLPEGPHSTVKRPGRISMLTALRAGTVTVSSRYVLPTLRKLTGYMNTPFSMHGAYRKNQAPGVY